jgi:hypothetical protein
MWATPNARDWKNPGASDGKRAKRKKQQGWTTDLNDQVIAWSEQFEKWKAEQMRAKKKEAPVVEPVPRGPTIAEALASLDVEPKPRGMNFAEAAAAAASTTVTTLPAYKPVSDIADQMDAISSYDVLGMYAPTLAEALEAVNNQMSDASEKLDDAIMADKVQAKAEAEKLVADMIAHAEKNRGEAEIPLEEAVELSEPPSPPAPVIPTAAMTYMTVDTGDVVLAASVLTNTLANPIKWGAKDPATGEVVEQKSWALDTLKGIIDAHRAAGWQVTEPEFKGRAEKKINVIYNAMQPDAWDGPPVLVLVREFDAVAPSIEWLLDDCLDNPDKRRLLVIGKGKPSLWWRGAWNRRTKAAIMAEPVDPAVAEAIKRCKLAFKKSEAAAVGAVGAIAEKNRTRRAFYDAMLDLVKVAPNPIRSLQHATGLGQSQCYSLLSGAEFAEKHGWLAEPPNWSSEDHVHEPFADTALPSTSSLAKAAWAVKKKPELAAEFNAQWGPLPTAAKIAEKVDGTAPVVVRLDCKMKFNEADLDENIVNAEMLRALFTTLNRLAKRGSKYAEEQRAELRKKLRSGMETGKEVRVHIKAGNLRLVFKRRIFRNSGKVPASA